jgi:phenylpyruvate tautomerase PptA (4-oxalocrotonate tautomerase family)
MPTYVVSTASGRLSAEMKHQIAREITRAHNVATGAQPFFAQVIFREVPKGDHFIGGNPLRAEQIFVHGHIRAGRSAGQKRSLLQDLVTSIAKVTSVAPRFIWAYLCELPPAQMIEYGHVLPEPGSESSWLEGLPPDDREYMQSLDASKY